MKSPNVLSLLALEYFEYHDFQDGVFMTCSIYVLLYKYVLQIDKYPILKVSVYICGKNCSKNCSKIKYEL